MRNPEKIPDPAPPDNETGEASAASSCSAWLFPEIEAEIKEDRSAAMREATQRVREEKRKAIKWLRGSNTSWVVNRLLDHGPTTEVRMLFDAMDDSEPEKGWRAIYDLWALWRIGKLWRVSKGIDPCAGVESFRYGIRKVHSPNSELDCTP